MSDRPDRVADDPWWWIAIATAGVLFRLTHRLRIEGVERIPESGPALLAANHVSPLDPIAVGWAAFRRGRTIRYLTAAEAYDIPVIGWGLRRFRQIPVRRGARDLAALEDAASVIAAGSLAGVFPEGRLGTGEALLPGRPGTARLALAAGAVVVPMAVWGMQRRWPRGGVRFRRPFRPIAALVIGTPIRPEGDPEDEVAVRALTDRVMSDIARLVERARVVAGDRPSQSEASGAESA